MRLFVLTLMLIFCGVAQKEQDCKCLPVKPNENTYWGGNELIVYKEGAILKSLGGIVLAPNGEPMSNALAEVFSPPGSRLSEYRPPTKKESRRIAACKTDAQGK